ncbi:MAG: hypothetical protein B6U85_06030 [Desulfurococcales archaeon ex4484_42]|nr:MAG: hypothetical protein B6U85_06030 [Desulfurococcales archaeon ex4484_42]
MFSDLFIDTIREVVDLRDIKYIKIHHMEPDHSVSLPKLLKEYNLKTIVNDNPLVRNLITSFYGIEPRLKPIKDLEVLTVGGKRLQFIFVSWLHWPETMITYIRDMKVLLTCDVFGGFGISPTLYDEKQRHH